jgi:hypothetical protein
MKRAVTLLLVSLSTTTHAQNAPDAPINAGHDVTKPLHKIDLFQNYTTPGDGINTWTSTLRYERPFEFENNWKIAYRFELPFIYSNDGSGPIGYRRSYGDTLMQAIISNAKISGREGIGFGLRFIAPTASDPALGTGKWLMLPTVGYRYSLPEISDGSYFQFVARYRFDFAGLSARSHYSDLQFAPSLNIALPFAWYLTLFPSTDIRYNLMRREWFVPFNFEIGRALSEKLQAGLEVGFPMIQGNFPVYKFKAEVHITILF